jgi:hypothetical protein
MNDARDLLAPERLEAIENLAHVREVLVASSAADERDHGNILAMIIP